MPGHPWMAWIHRWPRTGASTRAMTGRVSPHEDVEKYKPTANAVPSDPAHQYGRARPQAAVYDRYDRGDQEATLTQCSHHLMDARPPEGRGERGGRRLGQGSNQECYRLGTETLPPWGKPGFRVQEHHGGQIEQHREVDRHPSQARAPVQAPQGQEYAIGRSEKGRLSQAGVQFLSGQAAIGTYLCDRVHRTGSNECWWCGSGER